MKTTVAPMKKNISLYKLVSNTCESGTEDTAWVHSYSNLEISANRKLQMG